MDVETLYDLRQLTDVAVSPDGDRVAFTVDEFDREADERHGSVFVVPADGSAEPHRLTRASAAGGPKWSPDGTKLAVVAARERDLELAVTRDTDGGDEEGDDEDDENGDADEEGGTAGDEEEPKPQIWVWDLERGGDARQVTEFHEGAKSFDWSPDGDRLVVAARDPTDEEREYLDEREDGGPVETERLQHRYDGVGFLDTVTTYLFVVDLDDREATRLDDAYGGGALEAAYGLQPAWGGAPGGDAGDGGGDGDGRIAFLSNRADDPDDSEAMDVYAIRPDGEDCRRLTGGDVTASAPTWSPSGDRLAFVARDPTNRYRPTELFVCDAGGRAGSDGDDDAGAGVRSVSGDLDRPIARFGRPTWVDDGTLLAAIGDEGRSRLARFDADGGEPVRAFEPGEGDRTLRTGDADGGTMALGITGPDAPPDLFAMPVADAMADADEPREATEAGDSPWRLTRLNETLLREHATPNFARVSWENGDGDVVEGMLYLPADVDPSVVDADGHDPELPTVVSIHGGPVAYDEPAFMFQYAHWTGEGYAVLCPNYRGSSSYGQEFSQAIEADWGPREVDDVCSGVDHLVDRGVADDDRVFATGFSYGGMTTAHLVTSTDRFAAAAAEHGVYDYAGVFGTDDCHNWWVDEFGLPWEEPETYDRVSSLPAVGNVETPLLVTAGEEDWRCPPSEAEKLYVSVRKQGVPARLVLYPGEHHAVSKPDRAIHRLGELGEWFERFDPGA